MKRFFRSAFLGLAFIGACTAAFGADVGAGMSQGQGGYYDPTDRSGPYAIAPDGTRRLIDGSSTGGSPNSPTYTLSIPATFSTLVCTLPGYSAGGNVVCTNEAGQQTTTACAANTACLIMGDNPARRLAKWQTATPGASITIGYVATVAPGKGLAYDGPGTAGGQGGGGTDSNPAHRASYYAASNIAGAVLVFVQGQ